MVIPTKKNYWYFSLLQAEVITITLVQAKTLKTLAKKCKNTF